MAAMYERVSEPQDVMFIVRIPRIVQLINCGPSALHIHGYRAVEWSTDQFKNRDLHHTLVEIRRLVFDHFHGDNFVGLHILAFNHLPECPLAENVQNEVFAEEDDLWSDVRSSQRYRLAYL